MAQTFAGGQREVAASWHPDWLRRATIPFYVVCGPPASGKNTFVMSRASVHDLIIDLDDIMAGLTSDIIDKAWLNVALRRRNEMLSDITRRCPWRSAYLVIGEPKAENRRWWAEQMGATVYLLTTSRSMCEARIKSDPTRPQADLLDAIDRWFAAYTPRLHDIIVRDDDRAITLGAA